MDHSAPISRDDATHPAFLLRDLSVRQRVGLGIAAAAVIGGLAWSAWSLTDGDLVPLPTDAPITTATARELSTAFRSAGLRGFKVSGQRILVPRAHLDQYVALLPARQSTQDWAAEWERQNERLTPFSGSRARETNREIARAKLIAGMLRQLPDIEQADIVWDEDARQGWRQSPKTRATVYLNPKPDRVLTLDVIRAVRLAVAGSKKHLDPDDVVVMDLARQVTYEGALPRAIGDDLLPLLRSQAELYRREIREQIEELNGADVAVRIDLPRFFAFLAMQKDGDTDANREAISRRLSAIGPSLLRVSISLPQKLRPSGSEDDVRRSLQSRIAQLTGMGRGELPEQISVEFERPQHAPSAETPVHELAGSQFPAGSMSRVAGAVGILLSGVMMILLSRLMIHRRKSAQRSPDSTNLPVFHDVSRHSHQLEAAGTAADFDGLLELDAPGIRRVYALLTPMCWATALRGSSSQTCDHVAAALDPDAASGLRQELGRLRPVRIGDILSSRQKILETLDALHEPVV